MAKPTTNTESPHVLASQLKLSEARIIAELVGTTQSSDPFVQAVRTTRMPMVITDPRQSDNPIVFVNNAFCALTGYDRLEIIGRNCRFLQGAETDRSDVAKLRHAVDKSEQIELDLRNYRKNGTAFWNRLLMAPVWNESGALTYFFASQVDVTIERERLKGLENDNATLIAALDSRVRKQRESEARLKFAAEAGRLGLWEISFPDYKLTSSAVCKENFGFGPNADVTYEQLLWAVHNDDRVMVHQTLQQCLLSDGLYDVECRVIKSDGSIAWLHLRGQVNEGGNRFRSRLAGISMDITARKEAERRRLALEELKDRIGDVDDSAAIAAQALSVLGRTLDLGLVGFGYLDSNKNTLTTKCAWQGGGYKTGNSIFYLKNDGSLFGNIASGDPVFISKVALAEVTGDGFGFSPSHEPITMLAVPLIDDGAVAAFAFDQESQSRDWRIEDVTFASEVAERMRMTMRALQLRKQSERELNRLARHDILTGLPNRLLLNEHLMETLDKCSEANMSAAIMYIDIDRFKPVNDLFGHSIGDKLLSEFAVRLSSCLRNSDVVARLGGDEFAVVLQRCDQFKAQGLANRIIIAMSEPFKIESHDIEIGVSIGIAEISKTDRSSETLIRRADIAMYRAKEDGNTFRFFEDHMDSELSELRALEMDLRHAIERNELELFYQPIVHADAYSLIGFEALLRWKHPKRGLIPPGEFVPIAENAGLIVAIGHWVLETACREALRWPKEISVAVNLSPLQFRQRKLASDIQTVLTNVGFSPRRLELEVTEGVLIDHPDRAMSIMSALKKMGVKISLDDFGTGYSSLSYLRRFPFNTIKIDREFIRGIDREVESQAIVEAIGILATSLRLAVVAEGVETFSQLDRVRKYAATHIQGNLIGQPYSAQSVLRVISEWEETRQALYKR